MAKTLLEAGADLMTKNNFEETPLDSAINKGQILIVKLLLDNGALVEPPPTLRLETPCNFILKIFGEQ